MAWGGEPLAYFRHIHCLLYLYILITLQKLTLQLRGIILEILLCWHTWLIWLHCGFHNQLLNFVNLGLKSISLFIDEISNLADLLHILGTKFEHIFDFN